MIDLRRLHMLRLVHQYGTVTAAADALHLTPSAVSHHLRELARELKVPLLEPQGRRVRLTPAAHLLIEHADAMLARWEEALADLESHRAGAHGPLRMCGFTTAVGGLVAPAAGALLRADPALTIEIRECDTDVAVGLLAAGETDVAVIEPTADAPPPGDPRFDREPLMAEALDLIVPAGHPFAGRRGVRLEDAAAEAWISVQPAGCAHHQQVMAYCAAAGFTPRIAHNATTWSVIWALVGNGLGVSLVPRLADGPAGEKVVRVPLSGDAVPMRRVLTCVRRGSRANPLIARALGALRDAVPSRCALPPERPAA
ncbi:LysR family transcriptional regulator [Actinomadura violacea]|uniref:LysR family transcriptional regulator n=1 Tax=Actinomadura violacea TaxID=2819934 RepID=A0ABS3RZZ2_9ACTN|nr:LysR family transcriptional regulator [Actinomadura violacea]MBO2462257.1 LysR family transcriptional regulator [Actinomadura violacea]